MKKYLILVCIALFYEMQVSSQDSYFNIQFVNDKKELEEAVSRKLDMLYRSDAHFEKWEKRAYAQLKESGLCDKEDSLRVVFIYRFQDFDLIEEDIHNNVYLNKIQPHYTYFDYFLFPVFRTKFPLKKLPLADGYILNKDNILVAELSTFGRPILYLQPKSCIYSRDIIHDEKDLNLTENVLTKGYDVCFYLENIMDKYCLRRIWCVKGNETVIYDVDKRAFFTLKEFSQSKKR